MKAITKHFSSQMPNLHNGINEWIEKVANGKNVIDIDIKYHSLVTSSPTMNYSALVIVKYE
jgi:hypothetical protein